VNKQRKIGIIKYEQRKGDSMSRLQEMKSGKIEKPVPNVYPRHTRAKITFRETQQKHPEKRTDRIEFLQEQRSGTRGKTMKACMKV
jgi:hypothetical protein